MELHFSFYVFFCPAKEEVGASVVDIGQHRVELALFHNLIHPPFLLNEHVDKAVSQTHGHDRTFYSHSMSHVPHIP